MEKKIFGKGLFVRKDIDGKDCFVGDMVEIIRDYFEIEYEYGQQTIPSQKYIGFLRLSKAKGVYLLIKDFYEMVVIDDNGYEDFVKKERYCKIFTGLKFTDKAKIKQSWKKL